MGAKAKDPNFDDKGDYIGPDTLELTLIKPIKLHPKDENELTALTLGEPSADQMAAFQDTLNRTRNEFEAGCVLISKNAGVTLAQARAIKARDFQRALAFLTGFIQPGPETGES